MDYKRLYPSPTENYNGLGWSVGVKNMIHIDTFIGGQGELIANGSFSIVDNIYANQDLVIGGSGSLSSGRL